MAFKNIFGRSKDSAPAPAPEAPVVDAGSEADDDEIPQLIPERSWRERAEAVLPTGASTGSKRAAALYGKDADGPTHLYSARGARVTTVDGASYLDCTMSLGAVALGYAEP